MASGSKRNLFNISLPGDWEDQTIYTFKGPDDSGIQHNLILIIDDEPDNLELQDYAQMRIGSIKDTLPGFELMGEHEKVLKSGQNAYEVVYKWAPADGKMLIQKQIYLIIGDKAYNFTASFSKKTINTIGRQVDDIIESFSPIVE